MFRFQTIAILVLALSFLLGCSKTRTRLLVNPTAGVPQLQYNLQQDPNFQAAVDAVGDISPNQNCFQWIRYAGSGQPSVDVVEIHMGRCPSDTTSVMSPSTLLKTLLFAENPGEAAGMNTYYLSEKTPGKRIGRFQKNQSTNAVTLGSLCQYSADVASAGDFSAVCTISQVEGDGYFELINYL